VKVRKRTVFPTNRLLHCTTIMRSFKIHSLLSLAAVSTLIQIRQETKVASSFSVRELGGPIIIPNALEPPPANFTKCCLSRSSQDIQNSWKSTCYTPRACENHTLYPFQSVAEEEFMQQREFLPADKKQHRKHCSAAANQLHQEVTWCRVTPSSNQSLPESFYPTGCSQYSMGADSGPYDRMLIFPGAKLAFCGIPKSGITRWLQFLRFTLGAKDYQDAPYYKIDVEPFYFDGLTQTAQHEIWNDPAWTRAVLIREPTERLLAAYLDKIVPDDRFRNFTLAEFVSSLERPEQEGLAGLSWHTDPHWRPQAYSCGMAQLLPHLDYVGGLDRVAEHSRRILDHVGLWESHGRHYRVGQSKGPIQNPPPPLEEPTAGFQQEVHASDHHSRGAKSKLDAHYTPELRERVRKLYWMDYALWDAVQQASDEGKHLGKDVAALLNPEECGSGAVVAGSK